MKIINKYDSLIKVQQSGVVAVIRGTSQNNSYQTALACIDGGITAIELAFTSPNADETIKALSTKFVDNNNIVVGAGTVLDSSTARLAILAGAKFIVSPSFNSKTAKTCNLYDVPYIPGCFSPTDVQDALTYGSDVIKIFPSSILGEKLISEIHGPFPYINIMPSGGVSLNNMDKWFKNGAFVVGVGDSLVGPGKDNNYDKVRENAHKFYENFIEISNCNVNNQ